MKYTSLPFPPLSQAGHNKDKTRLVSVPFHVEPSAESRPARPPLLRVVSLVSQENSWIVETLVSHHQGSMIFTFI